MDELWPKAAANLDVAARLAGDARPASADRPWVTLVMISSLDGAIAIDGLSAGLGGPADLEWFVAARRQADGIIVGSGTAIAEDYQPTTTPIAVLSRSLAFDTQARLFGQPDRPPLLYTTAAAAKTRGADFDGIAEVIDLGDSVAPARALADLRRRGVERVVLEGGPTINGLFLAEDLVDEALVTISPLAVGGSGNRMVDGPDLATPHRFELARVLAGDDMVFLQYLRRRR